MKKNHIVWWAVAGMAVIGAVLLIANLLGTHGYTNYVYVQHGPGRGGHGGFMVRQVVHQQPFATGLGPIWAMLKLIALAGIVWLWTKASGIIRVGCAIAAGLTLSSLLSPLWGVLGLVILLTLRPKAKGVEDMGPSYMGIVAERHGIPAMDTGSFLDEWERDARR
ncbi:hypothetical protein [Paenibacillus soyae]|uniref:Uncharacterized protein n=1 Tax=Paenibacillus soyae TaxID=2969249 RepID=A0A9X2N2R2_9BACL|nr:hypothetical protein [Paenibacillus soyae]MCR2807987.1 hypothetical protein [Paenibacillus soyae]